MSFAKQHSKFLSGQPNSAFHLPSSFGSVRLHYKIGIGQYREVGFFARFCESPGWFQQLFGEPQLSLGTTGLMVKHIIYFQEVSS